MDQQAQQVPTVMEVEQQHADQYPEFVFLEEDLDRACDLLRDILYDDKLRFDEIRSIECDRERVIKMCECGISLLATIGTPYFAFGPRNRVLAFMVAVKGVNDQELLKAKIDSLESDLKSMINESRVKEVHEILTQALKTGENLIEASKRATKILNDHRTEELSKILARHYYNTQITA